MSVEFTDDSFAITTKSGRTIEFIQGLTPNPADCLVRITAPDPMGYVITFAIESEDIIEFVAWVVPPMMHKILAQHGVKLGKVW